MATKILDAEERIQAIDATRTLYDLKLIDMFIYEALIQKINENTGN